MPSEPIGFIDIFLLPFFGYIERERTWHGHHQKLAVDLRQVIVQQRFTGDLVIHTETLPPQSR
jgi:hypothetical protein